MITVRGEIQQPGLEFDEAEHRYTADGETIRSVTQILNLITAPIYARINPGVLEFAKQRGSNVHGWTEILDLGEAEPFGPAFRACDGTLLHEDHEEYPYVVAWQRFRRESGFEPEIVEQRLYHPLHRYAGTVDRIGILNGRRVTLEIKTVATLAPWVGLQTAAYHEAFNWAQGRRDRAARARERYAVQLRKDGTYRLADFADGHGDLATFLALKQVSDWIDANGSSIGSLAIERE